MKITRASRQEAGAYQGMYPLYGTAQVNGITVIIEELGEPQGPRYEILLPDGYIDAPQQQHFLLCFDNKDLLERLKALDPVPCSCCRRDKDAG